MNISSLSPQKLMEKLDTTFATTKKLFSFALLVVLFAFHATTYATSAVSQVERASTPQSGSTESNGASMIGGISSDGRYAVFASDATNLVTGDVNGHTDIFVRDRQAGTTELVSVATDGTQGNGNSTAASITDDGRYVAIKSSATNLATGGTTGDFLYVYDRQTHAMQYVADNVTDTPVIAGSGRYIVFTSSSASLVAGDTNGKADIFVYDMQSSTFERDSIATAGTEADDQSYTPTISADGRYVAYASEATNLVTGDTNTFTDIFVRDRQLNTTERVSIATDGTQGNQIAGEQPAISDDGRYVAFTSDASNLVDGDTNTVTDVFIYDRTSDSISRVSVADNGTETDDYSFFPSISSDGTYIAFNSTATTLISGDANTTTDVFVYDQTNHTIERISTAGDGTEANGYSFGYVSGDGRWTTFESAATNLVPGDTNSAADVFLAHIDTAHITISAISATPGSTTATVAWTTDVNASTILNYGTTSAYGTVVTGTDAVTSHTVDLSGLSVCTTYHYAVSSVDTNSNGATSGDNTFTTTGCPTGGGGGGGGSSHSSGGGGGGSSSSPTKPTTPEVPVIPNITIPPTEECKVTTGIMPKATLSRGKSGVAVGLIQRFLHDYGYYSAAIDDSFGPKMEAGIKAFQLAQHLPVTGIWDATVAHAADVVMQCSVRQIPTTPTLPIPATTAYVFNYDLRLGMNHPDVLKLQQYLNANGAVIAVTGVGSPGKETTYFGAKTKAAVAVFQRQHGIAPAVGTFGPITRAYVNTH